MVVSDIVCKYVTISRIKELLKRAEIVYDIDVSVLKDLTNFLVSSDNVALAHKELKNSFFKGEDYFKKYVASKGFEVSLSDVKEEVKEEMKAKLNLESVTDFVNDGKSYIKIKLSDGTNKILQNMTNYKADDIFNEIQKHFVSGADGELNVEEMFAALEKTFIDVPLTDSREVNTEKITDEQNKKKVFVESNFPGKSVEVSVDENIYIVKGEGLEDEVVKVDTKDNNYVIYKVEEQSYSNNSEVSNEEAINNEAVENSADDYLMQENEVENKIKELLGTGKSVDDVFMSFMTEREYNEQEIMDLYSLINKCNNDYQNSIDDQSMKLNNDGFQKKFVLNDKNVA